MSGGMTARDYKAIGGAIASGRREADNLISDDESRGAHSVLDTVAVEIADHCARVNDKFDRQRFLSDCGARNGH